MASTFVPQNLTPELGRSARRGVAESKPRVTLTMKIKIIEIPRENEGFQRSWGGEARRGAAESEPRVALSMESNM